MPIWGASTFEALSLKDQNHFKNLYHYYNNKIHADGEKFYLSPMNEFNIGHEYILLLENLKNNPLKPTGHFDYPLKCVFPARVEFLKSLGELSDLSLDDCRELNEWKNGLNAKSLSVVFSSSYPNNPSSMFGHTLIRLKSEKGSDILDYSVAFSAWQEATDSGFLLAVKGLFGGYRGLVELSKYYQKVNEYNYYESRDLIEYPVIMDQKEVDRFLNHLWEIYQTTFFDYYFADENCSSILYRLFKVAFREKELPNEKRAYFLPRELVENLMSAKLIDLSNLKVRDSLKKQFIKKYDGLTNDEKNDFWLIKNKKNLSAHELSQFSANTLESAKDFYYYKKARLKGNLETSSFDENKRLHEVLVARSKKGEAVYSETSTTKNTVFPHEAFEPGKLNLGFRYIDKNEIPDKIFLTLGFGLGFQDFTDSIKGQEAHQNFEVIHSKFRLNKNEFKLQNFTLINLKSNHAFTFYDPQASWAVEINYDDKFFNKKIHAAFGGGLSFLLNDSVMYGFSLLPAVSRTLINDKNSFQTDFLSFINIVNSKDINLNLTARKSLLRLNSINNWFTTKFKTEWSYTKNNSLNLVLEHQKDSDIEFFWSRSY